MKANLILPLPVVAHVVVLALGVARLPAASAEPELGVLRGRGLQIVDEQGRVRFGVELIPADSAHKMKDGTTVAYPETVILRMITADGKPRVKLTTSEDGSSLMLIGSTDTTQSILHASGAKSWLKLRNDEKSEKILGP